MTVESFRTDDADEEMAIFGQAFYSHRLTPGRNVPLRFSMTSGSIGPLSAGILAYGCEATAESTGLRYSVAVPLAGAFRFEFAGNAVAADPWTAALTTSGRPVTVRGGSAERNPLFLLGVDAFSLENHLRRSLGLDKMDSIDLPRSLDLRAGRGAQWWQLVRTLVTSLQAPNGLATNPMITAQLSSAVMTGLLLATEHPYREALDSWGLPVSPTGLKRALQFIELRADGPLTVVEVAEEVGSTVRALQLSFRKYLDTTPREQIRLVRMDRAHAMLVTGNPETTTVAQIAKLSGFAHLGRFAAQYRKIYGVLPRVTLHGR